MIAVAAVIVLIHPLDPITTTVQGRYYPAGVCSCVTTGKCWGRGWIGRGARRPRRRLPFRRPL